MQVELSDGSQGGEDGVHYTPTNFSFENIVGPIYKAENLFSDRFGWYPSTPSIFVTSSIKCDHPLVFNQMGICQNPKISCNDIKNQFNDTLKPCAVRVEGVEIDCHGSINISNCLMHTTMDICTKYSDHFIYNEQLVQVLYKGNIQISKFCNKRTEIPIVIELTPTIRKDFPNNEYRRS
jgi:hypothetical protein